MGVSFIGVIAASGAAAACQELDAAALAKPIEPVLLHTVQQVLTVE
jgi:hypothetical protein